MGSNPKHIGFTNEFGVKFIVSVELSDKLCQNCKFYVHYAHNYSLILKPSTNKGKYMKT